MTYSPPKKPLPLFGLAIVILFLILFYLLIRQDIRLEKIERGELVVSVINDCNQALYQDGQPLLFRNSPDGIRLVHKRPTFDKARAAAQRRGR